MRSGALSEEQIDAIASMVAGTQSGLKPEAVSITDGLRNYRTSFARAGATGENLDQALKIADAVQSRIATLLAAIEGVLIAVNPQVVTKQRTEKRTEFGEGTSVPTSESSMVSKMKWRRNERADERVEHGFGDEGCVLWSRAWCCSEHWAFGCVDVRRWFGKFE
jgi:flagellar biosynthesis/type III secretory pathway M-ring protein FliF/YscJ